MTPYADFRFSIDAPLCDAGVAVGFVTLTGFDNRQIDPAFYALRDERLDAIVEHETLEALRADPRLAAYRDLHAHFGIADPDYLPSPESLFEVLFRHRQLRRINPLVDLYNTVALDRRVSCGAHALASLDGSIRLSLVDGTETFVPLGAKRAVAVPAGEYAYIDGGNRIICRRECRQAAHSAVGEATSDAVIIVQGNAAITAGVVAQTCAEIIDLVGRYLPVVGHVDSTLVTAAPSSRAKRMANA